MNPLLDFSGLPRFAQVRPEHVTPAIDALLAENRALVAALTAGDTPATWDAFVRPLEDANERLGRAWGMVAHLHAVIDSPALREAYNENLPKVTQYWTELGAEPALFDKYKALRASPAFAALDAAQRKIVDNELRDFRLGGAELPTDQKQRFAAIQDELAALSAKFSENVLDATNAFKRYVEDRAELAGMPEDVLRGGARGRRRRTAASGWKFTLHAPSYLPVMQYADNRALRETLYRA